MSSNSELSPDGERFLPQFKGIIELEHYHRYFIALGLVAGKDVLDIASGEGFGTEILSRRAKSVTGVDISQNAVDHAQAKYSRDTVRFISGSATEIPLDDNAVDVVISFETIEHLADHDRMMKEVRRVLRPEGFLIISSPNRLVYSDRANFKNPFHVRELYTQDFLVLISRYFAHTRHYTQRVTTGSVIARANVPAAFTTYDQSTASPGLPDHMYDIIIAAETALPELGHSLFELPESALQPQKMEVLQTKYDQISDEYSLIRNQYKQASENLESLQSNYGKVSEEYRSVQTQCESISESSKVLQAKLENMSIACKAAEEKYQKTFENHQKVTLEKESLEAECIRLLKISESQESHEKQLEFALLRALRDGSALANDKWWLRTSLLRKWSNALRKAKSKPAKTWPSDFRPEAYLRSEDIHIQQEALSARQAGNDPDGDIPTVKYSEISEDFVCYEPTEKFETKPRAIAFYLPQFHPFEENDEWWGKGFTEWTNVGKAKPLFSGHHQPHCPIHLGYYDLRVAAVMEEQAALARAHGISGFAYYFYWFAGKVLMADPLKQMRENPKVDMPFCLIWANENWTRRWDGKEQDILIAQKHSQEDSRAILEYLRPFFEDPRYIRIDGKPLFIIYRADIIPHIGKTLNAWREQASSFGLPGLYIVCAQTFGQRDPRIFGFDAAMQFPPHTVQSNNIVEEVPGLEPDFSGVIYDYDQVVTNAVQHKYEDYKVFPTATLSWDNTARKNKAATVFARFSVNLYAQWLSSNAERVAKDARLSSDEKLVFVNAWNEWAEGTHLEPDQRYGYGYLAATRAVMKNYADSGTRFLNPVYPEGASTQVAVIVHIHYEHTWPDLRDAINRITDRNPDLYITATSLPLAELVARDFPNAIIEIVDNRGRDIRPFLHVLRKILALGYAAVCKIHGKSSSYRNDGHELRQAALAALLLESNIDRFMQNARLGMLVPKDSLIEHSDKNLTHSGTLTQAVAEELGISQWRGYFPAGSMFWFRPDALKPLSRLRIDDFDIERGLADGTRAHAIERLFCAVCKSEGFGVETSFI